MEKNKMSIALPGTYTNEQYILSDLLLGVMYDFCRNINTKLYAIQHNRILQIIHTRDVLADVKHLQVNINWNKNFYFTLVDDIKLRNLLLETFNTTLLLFKCIDTSFNIVEVALQPYETSCKYCGMHLRLNISFIKQNSELRNHNKGVLCLVHDFTKGPKVGIVYNKVCDLCGIHYYLHCIVFKVTPLVLENAAYMKYLNDFAYNSKKCVNINTLIVNGRYISVSCLKNYMANYLGIPTVYMSGVVKKELIALILGWKDILCYNVIPVVTDNIRLSGKKRKITENNESSKNDKKQKQVYHVEFNDPSKLGLLVGAGYYGLATVIDTRLLNCATINIVVHQGKLIQTIHHYNACHKEKFKKLQNILGLGNVIKQQKVFNANNVRTIPVELQSYIDPSNIPYDNQEWLYLGYNRFIERFNMYNILFLTIKVSQQTPSLNCCELTQMRLNEQKQQFYGNILSAETEEERAKILNIGLRYFSYSCDADNIIDALIKKYILNIQQTPVREVEALVPVKKHISGQYYVYPKHRIVNFDGNYKSHFATCSLNVYIIRSLLALQWDKKSYEANWYAYNATIKQFSNEWNCCLNPPIRGNKFVKSSKICVKHLHELHTHGVDLAYVNAFNDYVTLLDKQTNAKGKGKKSKLATIKHKLKQINKSFKELYNKYILLLKIQLLVNAEFKLKDNAKACRAKEYWWQQMEKKLRRTLGLFATRISSGFILAFQVIPNNEGPSVIIWFILQVIKCYPKYYQIIMIFSMDCFCNVLKRIFTLLKKKWIIDPIDLAIIRTLCLISIVEVWHCKLHVRTWCQTVLCVNKKKLKQFKPVSALKWYQNIKKNKDHESDVASKDNVSNNETINTVNGNFNIDMDIIQNDKIDITFNNHEINDDLCLIPLHNEHSSIPSMLNSPAGFVPFPIFNDDLNVSSSGSIDYDYNITNPIINNNEMFAHTNDLQLIYDTSSSNNDLETFPMLQNNMDQLHTHSKIDIQSDKNPDDVAIIDKSVSKTLLFGGKNLDSLYLHSLIPKHQFVKVINEYSKLEGFAIDFKFKERGILNKEHPRFGKIIFKIKDTTIVERLWIFTNKLPFTKRMHHLRYILFMEVFKYHFNETQRAKLMADGWIFIDINLIPDTLRPNFNDIAHQLIAKNSVYDITGEVIGEYEVKDIEMFDLPTL